ncbi:hypothetical protein C0991_007336 [Blastosporella zonata]|nr:hypothetical protein C0991_007336 [Blastosporella zonata]
MIPFQSGPPSIDVNNPFYCPAVPAASYIKSLHDQVRRKTGSRVQSRRYDRLVISFARVLENAVLTDAFDSSDDEKYDVTAGAGHRVVGNCGSPTSSSSSDEENPLSTIIPLWEREEDSWDQVYVASKKRKQDTFSDIRGPSKYAKSVLSAHDSSFDVSVKREALVYSDGPGSQAKVELAIQGETAALALRVRDLEGEAKPPNGGEHGLIQTCTESARDIHAFIERLDSMLPGIRLKERLSQLFIISHQSIIDFLGYNGTDISTTGSSAD